MVFNATFSNISVISRLLRNSGTTGPNKANKIRSNPINNIHTMRFPLPIPRARFLFKQSENQINSSYLNTKNLLFSLQILLEFPMEYFRVKL